MFTISQITDLPFQAVNVAAHFGFPDGVTVAELRPHSISPGGEFCAGTCKFTPEGQQIPIVRGFILKNTTPKAAVPTWTVVPKFDPLPLNWQGFSIRGINDRGDITGFFFVTPEEDSLRPYMKLSGQNFVELKVPPLSPVTEGTVWDISNDREIVGEYFDPNADDVFGFRAKLTHEGSIDAASFTDFQVDATEFQVRRVKSFNSRRDLLYVRDIEGDPSHFFEFASGPLAGPKNAKNITEEPIFGSLLPVMMNGVNNSRHVAGFFGPQTNRKGFLGQFDNHGVLNPFVFSHPSSLTDTRLFSISDDGIVVGVKGTKNPFFLIAKN